MGLLKDKELFDYEVSKPDQSEIIIKRGYHELVGKYIWSVGRHEYLFQSANPVTLEDLKEIYSSLEKLNKKSVLPNWIRWKRD